MNSVQQSQAAAIAAANAQASSRAAMMRNQYASGITAKGFSFTIPAGGGQTTVQLSGFANNFLGIAFFNVATTGANGSLSINNNIVFESVMLQLLEIDGGQGNARNFYEFPRPLNGQDNFNLSFTNTTGNALTVFFVIYYTNQGTI
jgi:hypothetical protein